MRTTTQQPSELEEGDQPSFDQLKQRLRLVFETGHADPVEAVGEALKAAWDVKDSARNGKVLRLVVTQPIRGDLLARAKVHLWLDRLSGGLAVRADIQMNGHDILRQRYCIDDRVKGADRRTNFALASNQYHSDDLQLQMEAFAEIPLVLATLMHEALPGAIAREGSTRIVAGEVCLDLLCDDPQLALRRDRLSPPSGTTSVIRTAFASATESGRKLCNKERHRKNGPELVVYEKWKGHVRVEQRAHGAAAVAALLDGNAQNEAQLDRESLYGLYAAFYHAAGEPCCERKDHFIQASRSHLTIVERVIALWPLFQVVRREALDGGYRPRAETVLTAKRLLVDLLTSGVTHAVGVPKGTQLRQVLEQLAAPNGPLVRSRRSTIFCFSVDYDRASFATGSDTGT